MSERGRPKADQYARKAAGWSDAEYADSHAYLDHRAALVASLGVALAPGDEVLDLACGDGGLGEHLLARGLALPRRRRRAGDGRGGAARLGEPGGDRRSAT